MKFPFIIKQNVKIAGKVDNQVLDMHTLGTCTHWAYTLSICTHWAFAHTGHLYTLGICTHLTHILSICTHWASAHFWRLYTLGTHTLGIHAGHLHILSTHRASAQLVWLALRLMDSFALCISQWLFYPFRNAEGKQITFSNTVCTRIETCSNKSPGYFKSQKHSSNSTDQGCDPNLREDQTPHWLGNTIAGQM